MALKKACSAFGLDFPDGYWAVAQMNLNKLDKTGQVVFLCWVNKAARDAGVGPIAQKGYTITAEQFDAFFGVDLFAGAFDMAKGVKDVGVPGSDPVEKVSFFTEALDII
jgi:hypothetical protein